MKKIGPILKGVWMWVTGKYKQLTSEDNIDAAIETVNTIKGLAYSGIADWLVSLTATGIDNKILAVIKDRTPKALAALLVLKTIPSNPTQVQIEGLINNFLHLINDDIADRQRLLTSLAAEILVALEDNKLTFGEAAAIIEKYYQSK